MSKDTVSAWDTTPANNTDVGGVDLAENSMRPRDVNNAIRTMMAQIATGIDNSEFGGVPQFTPASAAGPASLDFAEDTDNGTNRIRLIAPSSIASDKTATFQDITGTLYITGGTDVSLADGGTGASLVDPNADRIMFWDDSAGAVTWLAPSTGIAITTTNISLSFLGLEALTDPNADRVAFWDDSAGAFAWLTMGTNLTITGTTLDAAGGGGMTFLGTITTTSGSSQSLTSLTLTGYKFLKLSLNGVSLSGAGNIQMNGAAIGPALASGAEAAIGNVDIDLTNGVGSSSASNTGGTGATGRGFASGLTTASTAVTVTASAGTFDAGSIRVYGVP